MDEHELPIVDPLTGEVMASSDEDRIEVVQYLASRLLDVEREIALGAELRRKLALLMRVGDTVSTQFGAVACEHGPRPARMVNRQELTIHAEALAPLGLAPREETTVHVVYPRVSDVTHPTARAALARLGLNAESFLIGAGEPSPVIKIYQTEDTQ